MQRSNWISVWVSFPARVTLMQWNLDEFDLLLILIMIQWFLFPSHNSWRSWQYWTSDNSSSWRHHGCRDAISVIKSRRMQRQWHRMSTESKWKLWISTNVAGVAIISKGERHRQMGVERYPSKQNRRMCIHSCPNWINNEVMPFVCDVLQKYSFQCHRVNFSIYSLLLNQVTNFFIRLL